VLFLVQRSVKRRKEESKVNPKRAAARASVALSSGGTPRAATARARAKRPVTAVQAASVRLAASSAPASEGKPGV